MKQATLNPDKQESIQGQAPIIAPRIGRIAEPGGSGEVMVAFQDIPPRPARVLSGINRSELCKAENRGRDVLVVFEGGNPDRPIIIGLIESVLEDLVAMKIEPPPTDQKKPAEARLDGKRVVLEAEKEIQLKCGKGSITIKKDGKIIIKGTELLSRSSGTNRVKGASVRIN